MNIGFAGCSYTYGHELENPETDRFSKLICNQLNATEFNVSKAGASNEDICLKTMELIDSTPIDFMFVQLTTSNRFSFVLDNRIVTMRPSAIQGRALVTREGTRFDLINRVVYSSESTFNSWYPLSRWKVLALREYLKSKKIKHVFTFMSDLDANLFKEDNSIKDKKCFMFESLQSVTADLPLGKWKHPLEDGHKRMAEFLVGCV
jgi:hypothetical protein